MHRQVSCYFYITISTVLYPSESGDFLAQTQLPRMPEPSSFDRAHLEDQIRDARLRHQKAEEQIEVVDNQIKELEVSINLHLHCQQY
jgi:hypothetical protein